ncbi:MAG: putative baseplate assembly protein [Dehalococcoidia bacterium]|uniref:putative baseplate assembly protein n=1 Tax=Candidatus Amarobacter glycogenicus TaxID=3140699 RepID=UPI001E0C6826|nr:putative baseplate assembly protein [Dehalococcoidia bacterium]MBK7725906.1 putative baseplate assembly protein [Dehalococcoidia bacterium]MBK9343921.1 putative baseplate assembly protein [Dehalococcoidia bacterium]MBK9547318.1 putative baseplate assembly protein [Dehalococcoidia bacterium]
MPLPDPQLDDRRFQDIVNEAKGLIPRYCPEWTDHNVSDPGVTLIELFAWMTDMILYRMNRVPEKNYLRFMDLIGMRLKDAVPARTPVTLKLSAPQPGPVVIPRGTEVATVRTAEEQAISFTTDHELTIVPPTLRQCLFSSDDVNYADYTSKLTLDGEFFDAFQRVPLPGDTLHFGFVENLSNHVMNLEIDASVEGIGVDPRDPPLAWEAWCGETRGWVRCSVERDETGGLNTDGAVIIDLPGGMEARILSRLQLHWLRLRVIQPRPRQPTYSASPRVNTIVPSSIGGTVPATHSSLVINELLGRTSGVPGESIAFINAPLLARDDDEYLEVFEPDGAWERWQEVPDFRDSREDDEHYVIDGVSGHLTFGPAVREPDGLEHVYGRTPIRGSALRFVRYRFGGGVIGNVGANTLTVLKSSIPYVATVTNRRPAAGGLNPETLDAARLRAPMMIKTRDRAITAADFEFLAKEASRRVARARCIQVRADGAGSSVPPGTIELLIVPLVPPDHARTIESLQPPPELLEEVRQYLDERRLLGTQLVVDGPAYVGVSVEASILVQRHRNSDHVRAEVATRVREYLDPLLGGPDGLGWPFGRDLYLSEMQSVVQSVPGVEYAQDVTLYQVDIQTGQSRAAGQKITVADDVLLLSYEHVVTVSNR